MNHTCGRMMLIGLFGLELAAVPGCVARPAPETDRDARLGCFEAAWQMVAEGHYDTTFGDQDWQSIHDMYRQLVVQARSDSEFYDRVNRMLFSLDHSHLGIIPPGSWAAVEPTTFAEAGIGADVRMFGDDVVVTRVVEGSPAHCAGLRAGWLLTGIDGEPTARIVEARVALLEPPRHLRSSATNGVEAALYGPPGTSVELEGADAAGNRFELRLSRSPREWAVELDPAYPPFRLELEARVLDAGVGYIRFNTFAPVLGDAVLAAIDSLRLAPALVIDLRGNPGGVRAIADRLAARFIAEPTMFGAVVTRAGRHEVRLAPSGNPYTGPVVVLVDEMTRSAGEYFAGCLQAIGRATVVGTRTPGSVGPALGSRRLDNGAVLVGPVGRTTTATGFVIEGHGVTPDVPAPLERDLLAGGRDSQLEAALRLAADLAAGREKK